MLHLRDLVLCRAGIARGILDPRTLGPIGVAALGDPEPTGIAERLAGRGGLGPELERELLDGSWPDGPYEPDLVQLALALESGAVPFARGLELIADPPGSGSLRDRLASEARIPDPVLEELVDTGRRVEADLERILGSEPDRIEEPFLRFLSLSHEAGLFDPPALVDLLRWFHRRADGGRVRSWLVRRQGMDPDHAGRLVQRFFEGVPDGDHSLPATVVPSGPAFPTGRLEGFRDEFDRALSQAGPILVAGEERGARSPAGAEDRTVFLPDGPGEVRAVGSNTVGDYRLLGELGRGGMGVVYKAWQPALNRHVALKLMTLGEDADGEWVQRFLREAQAAAKLQHPNIVRVYDVGADGDRYYFTMDLIEGTSLAGTIGRRGVDPERLAWIGAGIARALQCAHEAGIVHRDVKPSNILIDGSGTPYLTDFGLAIDATGTSVRLTQTGATLGTPPYMPPEQVQGGAGKVDARSDVYSLGASLYEGITGKIPFDGSGVLDIVRKVTAEDPTPIARLRPGAPVDLVTVVEKAMDKNPRRRYQTALEFAEDLERFLAGDPVTARPLTRPERLARWIWRRKTVALAVSSTCLLFAALTLFGVYALVGHLRMRSLLGEGRGAFERGDYVLAYGRFREVHDFDPENLEADFGMRQAREELLKPLRVRVNEALDRRAPPAGRNDLEAIAREIESFQRRYPGTDDEAEDLALRIRSRIDYGDFSELTRHLRQGVDLVLAADRMAAADPNRQYEVAIQEFEAALRIDPDLVPVRFFLAYAYLREGRRLTGGASRDYFRKAAGAFDRAIEQAPASWALRFLRGTVHLLVDDYERAFVDMGAALGRLWLQIQAAENLDFPNWTRAYRADDPSKLLNFAFEAQLFEMVNVERLGVGERGERIEGIESPVDRETLQHLLRMSEDLLDMIERAFREKLGFLDERKNVVAVGAQIGRILDSTSGATLGRFLAAVTPFYGFVGQAEMGRQILEILPSLVKQIEVDPVERQLALGALRLSSGGPIEEARPHFEAALEAAPGSLEARFAYLWYLFRVADRSPSPREYRDGYLRALERVHQFLAEDPDEPALHLARGLAFFHLSSYEAALGEFDRATELFGGTSCRRADVHAYRAASLDKLGRTRDADAAWRRAQRFDPGTVYLEAWLRRHRLRVPYGATVYEVDLHRLPARQFEYAEEAKDLAEKAARLHPILYYHYREDPYVAYLAALRLHDLSVRLGRPRYVQMFWNLLGAGFDDETTFGPTRFRIGRYLIGWTDDEIVAALAESGGRHADVLGYLQGLAWEVVRVDQPGHLDEARARYRDVLENAPEDHPYVRLWAADALERLR